MVINPRATTLFGGPSISVRSQYKRLLSAHYYANGSGEKIKQWKTLQLTVILLGRSTDSTIIY
jgi:hypothetical protein